MRKLLPLFLILILIRTADAAQPVYKLVEHPEVTITSISLADTARGKSQAKRIRFALPGGGGSQGLIIGPKTWFIKHDREATFEDLKVGQHIRVHYIPRGQQAVAIEILRSE